MKFIKKRFFYTIVGFTQSHLGPLHGPQKGFFQKTSGIHKKENPINITGIDDFLLKCDCINGPIVNRIREPIFVYFCPL